MTLLLLLRNTPERHSGDLTATGGGNTTLTGTAFSPTTTPPTPTPTTTTGGGFVHLPPPRRKPRELQPLTIIRSGVLVASGGGSAQATGHKGTAGVLTASGNGTTLFSGYRSSEIMLVRYAADGHVTRTEPVDTGPTLEQELQRLVEDALVLAEALN